MQFSQMSQLYMSVPHTVWGLVQLKAGSNELVTQQGTYLSVTPHQNQCYSPAINVLFKVRLHVSQVTHQARAYPGFCSMK